MVSNGGEVAGWLLAWLPEGASHYNFEFFQELRIDGKPAMFSFLDGAGRLHEPVRALERADMELSAMKEKAYRRWGMFAVAHAYVHPVTVPNVAAGRQKWSGEATTPSAPSPHAEAPAAGD